jgi:hypothetical protein
LTKIQERIQEKGIQTSELHKNFKSLESQGYKKVLMKEEHTEKKRQENGLNLKH